MLTQILLLVEILTALCEHLERLRTMIRDMVFDMTLADLGDQKKTLKSGNIQIQT